MSQTQALALIEPVTSKITKLVPYEQIWIQISKAEHIELKAQANYWEDRHKQAKHKINEQQHELDIAKATIRDLNQRLYGKKSEKKSSQSEQGSTQTPTKSTRPKGQQAGSQGHGRTARPNLTKHDEYHDIASDKAICPTCLMPYKLHPHTEDSEIIEIQVKSYTRVIKRAKYTRKCPCVNSPGIITAPIAPRLIPKSSLGTSIWTEVLLSKYLYSRATHNLCIEYQHRGIEIAQGTLTGGLKKIATLFEPLVDKLTAKQLTEELFHNDETGWKVFEKIEGKVGYRWWLWVTQSQSVVHYTIDPSRSGDIPISYFSNLDKHLEQVIVVCDRYKGYIRLAREIPLIILAFCWAHVRRDFLDAAKSYPDLKDWMLDWVENIGELYHLNKLRLKHWDKAQTLNQQNDEFIIHHKLLQQAAQKMANERDQILEKTDNHQMQNKVLNSLKNHWQGLLVFIDNPQVPMDNNIAERRMRNPGMGRKNYYGSGSQWSAKLAAQIFSLFQTILLWNLNPHHWLYSYLSACAENGGHVPDNIQPFIPWMMDEPRKQALSQPLSTSILDPNSEPIWQNQQSTQPKPPP